MISFNNRSKIIASMAVLAASLAPGKVHACACGCGVFDVGTSSMFPTRPGGMAFVEYDYQDQNRNWSGFSKAPAGDNPDKEIETHFLNLGLQYMFDRDWGVQVQLPYDFRSFTTTGGASGNDIVKLHWSSFGDVRLKGIYTGFSPDLSTGVSFGLKLPTGSWSHNDAYGDIDRDSELGTGSSDILLGAFHRGHITDDALWNWYIQGELDVPVLTQDHYRPGVEFDAAAGVHYDGWAFSGFKIRPVAQVIFSERSSDSGENAADPVASGYQRILLSPGLEFDAHPVHLYADVEFPVLQHMTGDQLVAPALFKVVMSYMF